MIDVLELDCIVCGNVFLAKRAHARYCSDSCRKRSSRLRKRDETPAKRDNMPVVPAAAMVVTEDAGVVVPPARSIIAPEEGRASGKPLNPLSDEEYAVRLERHLAQCADGHDWHQWPAGLISCLRCYSRLEADPNV